MSHDFDVFWENFPRKIGKLDAMKAYTKAISLASAEDILVGVQQFNAHLPDEARFIPYPASWLRAGRWMDQYEAPVQQKPYWADECAKLHGGTCENNWNHGLKMRNSA